MNKKGFTLVELLATLVVLGIVTAITVVSINGVFNSAKSKSEDVFVDTIEDAMEMYLATDAKKLNFDTKCDNFLDKSYNAEIKVYKVDITFEDVINSSYKPITEKDLVNPANEEVKCNIDADVTIYRDEDFVYYYSINRESFDCLKNTGIITNLPKIKNKNGEEVNYTCN